MFSFLKRFFGKVVQWAQAPAIDAPETTQDDVQSEGSRIDTLRRASVLAESQPVEFAQFQPEPAVIEPYIPGPGAHTEAPQPTISEDFLRGSVFDDDDEEEELPGDKANLGMVPSIGNPYAYMIGLVGEQYHAEAVHDLREGTVVTLELEPGNPEDPAAIAAVDPYGRVIGYVSRDSWLREAVYGGGSGFSAKVLAVEEGSRGFAEVVLEVEPSEQPLLERAYEG